MGTRGVIICDPDCVEHILKTRFSVSWLLIWLVGPHEFLTDAKILAAELHQRSAVS